MSQMNPLVNVINPTGMSSGESIAALQSQNAQKAQQAASSQQTLLAQKQLAESAKLEKQKQQFAEKQAQISRGFQEREIKAQEKQSNSIVLQNRAATQLKAVEDKIADLNRRKQQALDSENATEAGVLAKDLAKAKEEHDQAQRELQGYALLDKVLSGKMDPALIAAEGKRLSELVSAGKINSQNLDSALSAIATRMEGKESYSEKISRLMSPVDLSTTERLENLGKTGDPFGPSTKPPSSTSEDEVRDLLNSASYTASEKWRIFGDEVAKYVVGDVSKLTGLSSSPTEIVSKNISRMLTNLELAAFVEKNGPIKMKIGGPQGTTSKSVSEYLEEAAQAYSHLKFMGADVETLDHLLNMAHKQFSGSIPAKVREAQAGAQATEMGGGVAPPTREVSESNLDANTFLMARSMLDPKTGENLVKNWDGTDKKIRFTNRSGQTVRYVVSEVEDQYVKTMAWVYQQTTASTNPNEVIDGMIDGDPRTLPDFERMIVGMPSEIADHIIGYIKSVRSEIDSVAQGERAKKGLTLDPTKRAETQKTVDSYDSRVEGMKTSSGTALKRALDRASAPFERERDVLETEKERINQDLADEMNKFLFP